MLLANLWHKIILKAADAPGWHYFFSVTYKGSILYFRIAHHAFCLPSKILTTNVVSHFSCWPCKCPKIKVKRIQTQIFWEKQSV